MASVLPGKVAQLSAGDLYYHYREPEQDRDQPSDSVVVTVHGFACGMLSLESLSETLADSGFSVLSFDFFGCGGHSDAPLAPYGMGFFLDTLDELLEGVGLGSAQIDLVGYSMGCGIAAKWAARQPERARKVVLLDPVHGPVEWLGQIVNTPGVGEVVGRAAAMVEGCEILVKHLEKEYQHPEWPHVRELMDRQFELIRRTHISKPNLVPAAVRTVQNFPFPNLIEAYKALGKSPIRVPTNVIWGDLSKYFPTRANVATAIPWATEDVVHDAGHMLFAEKPQDVNTLVERFLSA